MVATTYTSLEPFSIQKFDLHLFFTEITSEEKCQICWKYSYFLTSSVPYPEMSFIVTHELKTTFKLFVF